MTAADRKMPPGRAESSPPEVPGRPAMRLRTAILAVAAVTGLAMAAAGLYYAAATSASRGTLALAPAPPRAPLRSDLGSAFSMLETPRPLPELRFLDGVGKETTLAAFRGKAVLLNLWATWCVPCREEMPTLDRLQAELGGPGFEVVALSIDRAGLDVVRRFYAEIGVRHLAMYIDGSGEAARELNVLGLPTTLLVDREGREFKRLIGPAEWDAPEMVAFIRAQLSDERGSLGLTPADRGLASAATTQQLLATLDLPVTGNPILHFTSKESSE